MAFPCNQFGSQEPHPAEWMEENIVKKYNIKYHMMKEIQVMGARQSPIWKWIRDNSDIKGADMTWNFEKFLINSKGDCIGHWGTKTEIKDITETIKTEIGA